MTITKKNIKNLSAVQKIKGRITIKARRDRIINLEEQILDILPQFEAFYNTLTQKQRNSLGFYKGVGSRYQTELALYNRPIKTEYPSDALMHYYNTTGEKINEKHIDFDQIITEDTNYKDQLLRLFQSKFHVPPRYKEVAVQGPPHDREFTMGVLDPHDNVLATATARNKKVAEQEASRLTLELLMNDA
jgi:hypothetical protein